MGGGGGDGIQKKKIQRLQNGSQMEVTIKLSQLRNIFICVSEVRETERMGEVGVR